MPVFSLLLLFVGILAFANGQAALRPRHHADTNIPTVEDWKRAEKMAAEFVAQLDLTEKATLVTGNLTAGSQHGCIGYIQGIERLGFKGLCLLDGPNAVNRAHLVSAFPSGLTAAASWDRALLYKRGVALGEEFKNKGAHVILGPTTGPMGRHPLGGRNWEGFSVDPYLSGEVIKHTVMGQQSVGVQTSSKHFIGNEQETQRSSTTLEDGTVIEGISSNIDDRTLHELYLWPFADAVRAGTTSIMCSYNRLNLTYACEQPRVLTDILRKELGFRGYVVSDWFATHSTSEASNAGLDVEQPGEIPPGIGDTYSSAYFGAKLEAAVRAGNVTEGRLESMARRFLTPYFLLGQDSSDYPSLDPEMPLAFGVTLSGWTLQTQQAAPTVSGRDVRGDHHKLIRKMGASAAVLLKNDNNILPLTSRGKGKKGGIGNIGVFGSAAITPIEGLVYQEPPTTSGREYGVLTIGGGSGSARNPYIISPLEAIEARAEQLGATVQSLVLTDMLAANDFRNIYSIPDVCLVFLKTWASESYDRPSFELDWNSTLAVNNVAALCGANRTVVITNSAGVNTMPWADNVTAILAAHYPGQEVGNSIVDVLWGQAEPNGRLPYTIPKTEEDYGFPVVNLTNADGTPERDSSKWQANFTEGPLIDYRHFDANNIEPLFEFGFGLGYTSFQLKGGAKVKKLAKKNISDLPDPKAEIAPGGNTDLWSELIQVSVTLENTGQRKGSTVVQLYLSFPEEADNDTQAVRVLRGFEKVELGAKRSSKIDFVLKRRDLSNWDATAQQWRIPRGTFKASVGFSSRDLPVETELDVLGSK